MTRSLLCLAMAASAGTSMAQVVKGPSSSQTPYVWPTVAGGKTTSVLTAGDNVNGYVMAGLCDGLGAFDNGNGTFTLLMNHEFGSTTSGAVHAHGQRGAFVSKWIINKSNLSVVSGSDLIQNVMLWNKTTSSYNAFNASNPNAAAAFARFCSADLAPVSAFYNAATGMGTQERIYMNGEETGTEGRAMGHIVTGAAGGTSYELPRLGKLSIENSVANPATGNKTVVALMDDATPGQVYFYVGTKTNSGSDVEKAGLTNGTLYSISVSGMLTEVSASIPAANTSFSTINIGNVQNWTGVQLDSASNVLGVTRFLRPEDGAWDPQHPEDFYFNTTNAINAPSRVWRVHFSNINDLAQGGTITAVLDGTEGQKMLDNMAFDNNGHLLLQEDVGGDARNGRMWMYTLATDQMVEVARHDSTRFEPGGSHFLTIDEETTGIINMQDILGAGWFLSSDQAHYSQPSPLVEGGQLFAFFNPETYNAACAPFTASISVSPSTPVAGQLPNTIYLGYGPQTVTLNAGAPNTYAPVSYSWMPGNTTGSTLSVSPTNTTSYSVTATNSIGCVSTTSQTITVKDIRDGNKQKVFICYNGNTMSISVNAVPALLNNGAMLGGCNSSAKLITAEESFSVYPNPANNVATLTVSLKESKDLSIEVLDLQGRRVVAPIRNAYNAGSYQISIPTGSLTSGTYTIRVAAGNEMSNLRLVIAH